MSRSFVVGKRSSRVVFGRFCAEAVVNEQTTIVIERKKKRQGILIEQQERSDQSAVERIGCNSDFISDWMHSRDQLDSEWTGNADAR